MKATRLMVICCALTLGLCIQASAKETEFEQTKKLAEAGDADAQFRVGLIYAEGAGVPRDGVEAVKWFRMAAHQHHSMGQNGLGVMYSKGEGVKQDQAEAAKWFRKAADQGYASAQHNLGTMCLNGEGMPQDHIEAAKWFRMAADRGDDRAQYNLGLMY
jgi:TPR repeat protein